MNYEDSRRTLTARPNINAIKMAMKFRNNMSKADLARLSGVSKGTVGNVLNGNRKTFNPETAHALATALGVASDDIFTLEPLTVKVARRAAA